MGRETYKVVGRGRVLDKAQRKLFPRRPARSREHDVVLLELHREADRRAFRVRRAEKDYYALPEVVVLGGV